MSKREPSQHTQTAAKGALQPIPQQLARPDAMTDADMAEERQGGSIEEGVAADDSRWRVRDGAGRFFLRACAALRVRALRADGMRFSPFLCPRLDGMAGLCHETLTPILMHACMRVITTQTTGGPAARRAVRRRAQVSAERRALLRRRRRRPWRWWDGDAAASYEAPTPNPNANNDAPPTQTHQQQPGSRRRAPATPSRRRRRTRPALSSTRRAASS